MYTYHQVDAFSSQRFEVKRKKKTSGLTSFIMNIEFFNFENNSKVINDICFFRLSNKPYLITKRGQQKWILFIYAIRIL